MTPNAERVPDITPGFWVIRSVAKRVGDAVRQGEALATVESNESLQTYVLTAPLSGVVTARHANPGEQTGDRALFTVADLSTVWVEVALFPRDRARVQAGQSVRARSTDTAQRGRQVVTSRPSAAPATRRSPLLLLDNATADGRRGSMSR